MKRTIGTVVSLSVGATVVMLCGAAHGQSAPPTSTASPPATEDTRGTSGSMGASRSESTAGATTAGESTSHAKGNALEFMTQAAMDGLLEVQAGKVAQNKSQDAAIKRFAQQMVRDHSQANDELMQLAQSKGIRIPTDLDAKHQAKLDKLRGLDGSQFDRAYSKDMKQDHDKTVKMFEHAAKSASDPDVKAFAARVLPTLRDHQHMAQSLATPSRG